MGKADKTERTSRPSLDSQEYVFELKGRPRLFIKQAVRHSFQPVKALDNHQLRPCLTTYSVTPKFNFDKKYYSQSFSTEFEGLDADTKLRQDHKLVLKELST